LIAGIGPERQGQLYGLWELVQLRAREGLGGLFQGLADRVNPPEPVSGGGGVVEEGPVGIVGIGRLASVPVRQRSLMSKVIPKKSTGLWLRVLDSGEIRPASASSVARSR
jgi:hypothetical protein